MRQFVPKFLGNLPHSAKIYETLPIQLLPNFGPLRKLAVIALLFIYSATQLGPVLVNFCGPLAHAVSVVRQQRRMRLEATATKDILMTPAQYQASLHEKNELLIDGILHDVKDIKIENGIVHLQLLEDSKETNWMNDIASVVNELNKQKRSQRSMLHVWNWLFNIYTFEKEIKFVAPAPEQLVYRLAFNSASLRSVSLSSPGQPPELIS